MFEPYLMGQYQYPWQGMTPAPNWQPQTPQVAQGQQCYVCPSSKRNRREGGLG